MEEFNAAVHPFGAAGKGILSGRIRYSLYPVGRLSPLSAEGVDDFADSLLPGGFHSVPELDSALLELSPLDGRSFVLGKARRSGPPADPLM